MDALQIIDHFYPEDTPLKQLLLKHSMQVRDKALALMAAPEVEAMGLNRALVLNGAMLHDIGIGRCHAPSILCNGDADYICHGIIGAAMLREFAPELEAYARICERHTGAGITAEEIAAEHLPLPLRDYLPETPEEKLICLADKFFSKSGDQKEKSLDRIIHELAKFGPAALARFNAMCELFHVEEQK